jgi:hypothetical protein
MSHFPASRSRATICRKNITYYIHNEKRMDYVRFRQQGYLIGSGTIESACKQIAAARLKCSGVLAHVGHWLALLQPPKPEPPGSEKLGIF